MFLHVNNLSIFKNISSSAALRGMEEGNVLFNDTLNTFYLRLYGVGQMVKNHSDNERGNPLPLLDSIKYV